MTEERQIAELPGNQVTVKRGFPVYRTNPSVAAASGMVTRNKRFHVPGGKASMIVDNSTGKLFASPPQILFSQRLLRKIHG
jgi:hypothetical protein